MNITHIETAEDEEKSAQARAGRRDRQIITWAHLGLMALGPTLALVTCGLWVAVLVLALSSPMLAILWSGRSAQQGFAGEDAR